MTQETTHKILLKVDALKKTFVDSGAPIHVLKGASLSLEQGKNVAITGQSGSGKSTFLNIICGLESFDEGMIEWNGISVKNLSEKKLSKLRGNFFGFIFQSGPPHFRTQCIGECVDRSQAHPGPNPCEQRARPAFTRNSWFERPIKTQCTKALWRRTSTSGHRACADEQSGCYLGRRANRKPR